MTLMSEVFFTAGDSWWRPANFKREFEDFPRSPGGGAAAVESRKPGKNKAGRLPLSDPPSRFLSYPKISLGEKVFVVAADYWIGFCPCQIEFDKKLSLCT